MVIRITRAEGIPSKALGRRITVCVGTVWLLLVSWWMGDACRPADSVLIAQIGGSLGRRGMSTWTIHLVRPWTDDDPDAARLPPHAPARRSDGSTSGRGSATKWKHLLTKGKFTCYTVSNTHTSIMWRPLMLQLSLGYVVQAEREREVAEDLRNRQSLQPSREARPALPATPSQPLNPRRNSVRVRSTGA